MWLVLDTSVSLTWLLPNGTAEQIALADRVLKHMESSDTTLSVPNLWWLEWTNAVSRAQQKSLVTPQQVIEYTELIAALGVNTTFPTAEATLANIFPLAMETGLTTYDATYLHLAIELQAPLATADSALRQAAISRGIRIF